MALLQPQRRAHTFLPIAQISLSIPAAFFQRWIQESDIVDSAQPQPPMSDHSLAPPSPPQPAVYPTDAMGSDSPSSQTTQTEETPELLCLSNCAICPDPGIFLCAKCNDTLYCSKRCQEYHWLRGHQHSCTVPYPDKRAKPSGLAKFFRSGLLCLTMIALTGSGNSASLPHSKTWTVKYGPPDHAYHIFHPPGTKSMEDTQASPRYISISMSKKSSSNPAGDGPTANAQPVFEDSHPIRLSRLNVRTLAFSSRKKESQDKR
jgi:hypothetical protein